MHSTARGCLALAGILLFARIYYIVAESKRHRQGVMLGGGPIERRDVEELPHLFGLFLLVLAGMPLLR
jgi:hypothetical protein